MILVLSPANLVLESPLNNVLYEDLDCMDSPGNKSLQPVQFLSAQYCRPMFPDLVHSKLLPQLSLHKQQLFVPLPHETNSSLVGLLDWKVSPMRSAR